jgi:hypothetical protein
MIRPARIPPILNRICTDQVIQTAILVTADGGRLGSTSMTFVSPDGSRESVESLGPLIADIAVDYQRLGDEYAGLDNHNNNNNGTTTSMTTTKKKSHMQCLLLELDQGLMGVLSCVRVRVLLHSICQ